MDFTLFASEEMIFISCTSSIFKSFTVTTIIIVIVPYDEICTWSRLLKRIFLALSPTVW